MPVFLLNIDFTSFDLITSVSYMHFNVSVSVITRILRITLIVVTVGFTNPAQRTQD